MPHCSTNTSWGSYPHESLKSPVDAQSRFDGRPINYGHARLPRLRVPRKYGLVLLSFRLVPTPCDAATCSAVGVTVNTEGAPGSVFEPGSWVDFYSRSEPRFPLPWNFSLSNSLVATPCDPATCSLPGVTVNTEGAPGSVFEPGSWVDSFLVDSRKN